VNNKEPYANKIALAELSKSLSESRREQSRMRAGKLLEHCGIGPSFALIIERYIQFGIVGASGIAVDMAALFVLADPRMLHWNLSMSKALAAEIAIFSNFFWNECWTFREFVSADTSWHGRKARFRRFNLICLAGIGISVLLLNVQTRFFQMNMYVGNVVAILIVSLWNFGMNLKFSWSRSNQ